VQASAVAPQGGKAAAFTKDAANEIVSTNPATNPVILTFIFIMWFLLCALFQPLTRG